MKDETVSRVDLIKRFEKATKTQKAALTEFFGEDFFKVDITDRVKSFEDACEVLGISDDLPHVANLRKKHQKAIIADYKLGIITEALNEGWVPDWADTNEYKWFPWWYVSTDRSNAGLAFASTNSTAASPNAYYGSRLGFKTRELAQYATDQFKDLYEAFLLF
ncbi:MAG: hypothetical protein ABFD76_16590 [Smithella sp.]